MIVSREHQVVFDGYLPVVHMLVEVTKTAFEQCALFTQSSSDCTAVHNNFLQRLYK